MSSFGLCMRKTFNDGDEIRDEGLTTPEDVARFDGIAYGPDEKWNTLDVYRPKDHSGKLPVIISFHGGGWVYGDKERYQYYCMNFARHGFAVVNFTYRLAPEFQHPAGLEDMNRIAEWVMNNSERYGFVPLHGGTVPEMEAMNLFKHITRDFPPVFAATGTGDFLRVQLHHLVKVLVDNDIPFCSRYYTSPERELGHDFCCNMRLKEAHECADDLCGFFRKFCGKNN